MVTVVQEPSIQSTNPFGIFKFIGSNIGLILFALLVLILSVVIYILIQKIKDERKERDDPIYQNYMNTIRACNLQADKTMIRKKYSFINLLWLGIPFKWNEHSNKIINYTNEIIGYYRGHYYSQDGALNILVYLTKSFGLIENRFIIKCPITLKVKTRIKNSKEIQIKNLNFKNNIQFMPNSDIKLWCVNLEKLSYFWYPVYISKNKELIDLRASLNENFIEIGNSEMLSRVLALGSKNIEKAMLHNPNLIYEQKAPEKTQAEEQNET